MVVFIFHMAGKRFRYHLLALAVVAVCGTVLALAGMALVVFDGQRLQLSAEGD